LRRHPAPKTVVIDRRSGLSLTQVSKLHNISRASVCRLMKESNENSRPAADVNAAKFAFQAGA
jgi:hypothetical protein